MMKDEMERSEAHIRVHHYNIYVNKIKTKHMWFFYVLAALMFLYIVAIFCIWFSVERVYCFPEITKEFEIKYVERISFTYLPIDKDDVPDIPLQIRGGGVNAIRSTDPMDKVAITACGAARFPAIYKGKVGEPTNLIEEEWSEDVVEKTTDKVFTDLEITITEDRTKFANTMTFGKPNVDNIRLYIPPLVLANKFTWCKVTNIDDDDDGSDEATNTTEDELWNDYKNFTVSYCVCYKSTQVCLKGEKLITATNSLFYNTTEEAAKLKKIDQN